MRRAPGKPGKHIPTVSRKGHDEALGTGCVAYFSQKGP